MVLLVSLVLVHHRFFQLPCVGQKGPTAFTVCSERDWQSGVNETVQVSEQRRWFRAPVPTLYHTTTALLTVCLFLFCLTSIKINETGKLYIYIYICPLSSLYMQSMLKFYYLNLTIKFLNEILQMCMRGLDITDMTLATLSMLCFLLGTNVCSVNNLLLINRF